MVSACVKEKGKTEKERKEVRRRMENCNDKEEEE